MASAMMISFSNIKEMLQVASYTIDVAQARSQESEAKQK